MEAKLGLELLHISAERVVSGNQVDTVSLLELVAALCRTSTAGEPPPPPYFCMQNFQHQERCCVVPSTSF